MIAGIAAITIHAPARNFVLTTMIRTTNVAVAPMELMTMLRRHPLAAAAADRLIFSQCRTIPVCDRVKEVNTPTTYSWMSRSRLALNAHTRSEASNASRITPLEKTSRSPRFSN